MTRSVSPGWHTGKSITGLPPSIGSICAPTGEEMSHESEVSCLIKNMVKKVKFAFEPSGPSGRILPQFSQHEAAD